MKLQAGEHRRRSTPVYVEISTRQRDALGFGRGEQPKKIGCGLTGCAYVAGTADAIVKLTQDDSDARTAFHIALKSTAPLSSEANWPAWAIPVYGAYRLDKGVYAICTARGSDIPEALGKSITELFEWCDDNEIAEDEWDGAKDEILMEIVANEAKHGRNDVTVGMKQALDLVDEVVVGFREIGLDWADAKADNWKMWNGRPVLIDFGLTRPLDPKVKYPKISDLPKL